MLCKLRYAFLCFSSGRVSSLARTFGGSVVRFSISDCFVCVGASLSFHPVVVVYCAAPETQILPAVPSENVRRIRPHISQTRYEPASRRSARSRVYSFHSRDAAIAVDLALRRPDLLKSAKNERFVVAYSARSARSQISRAGDRGLISSNDRVHRAFSLQSFFHDGAGQWNACDQFPFFLPLPAARVGVCSFFDFLVRFDSGRGFLPRAFD